MADHNDLGSEEGVVYAPEDFAGLLLRSAVLLIDGIVLFAIGVILVTLSELSIQSGRAVFHEYCLLTWVYLAVMKPSRIRTVGYWVTGLRIVTLQGERPSVLRMTFRMLLLLVGPFSVWIDLPWVASDRWKQSLRDKLAATYVIRKDAEPIGKGVRRAAYYGVMGYQFVCWEIRPISTPTPNDVPA